MVLMEKTESEERQVPLEHQELTVLTVSWGTEDCPVPRDELVSLVPQARVESLG